MLDDANMTLMVFGHDVDDASVDLLTSNYTGVLNPWTAVVVLLFYAFFVWLYDELE